MAADKKDVVDLINRFEQHTERFEQHELEDVERFNKLVAAQESNTNSVSKLVSQVSSLVEDTTAVVQLQKDLHGAARVGKGVQNFFVWCLKWGAIGLGVVAGLSWIVEKFQH